jgi:hypothetical protein
MIPPKLSVKDKLMFIPKSIDQTCKAHQVPAIYFCSKNNCQFYTYLCGRCQRENSHGHIDEISDYSSWVEKMVEKIGKLKTTNNRIFHSLHSEVSKNDFKRYIG